MSDKKVIDFVSKGEIDKSKYKADLLDTIDSYRQLVESGQVEEFVISSLDSSGEVVITVCCKDLVGSVGLFEMGKNILLSQ
jgi:hypothetical protein